MTIKSGKARAKKRVQKIAKPAIKAIIFDLGNVLIGFDHQIAVKRILAHTLMSEGEIYNLFFDSTLTRAFEEGKISPLLFFKKVKAMLGLKIAYEEFLPIWNEIFFAKPKSEEFIASLPAGIRRVMLSNVNQLHYEYILGRFPEAIALFGIENIIASCMTGFIKPAKEIYELAIKKTGVLKENIIYVDDRLDLIDAARGYGIQSVQFNNIEQLQQEFQNLGIIAHARVSL